MATAKTPAATPAGITIRALAALMVDIVTGAPRGTTLARAIPWYSPAVMYAYQFAYRAIGRANGDNGEFVIGADVVDAFITRVNAIVASRGDAARLRYAHTRDSGWVRGGGDANVALPMFGTAAKTAKPKTGKNKTA